MRTAMLFVVLAAVVGAVAGAAPARANNLRIRFNPVSSETWERARVFVAQIERADAKETVGVRGTPVVELRVVQVISAEGITVQQRLRVAGLTFDEERSPVGTKCVCWEDKGQGDEVPYVVMEPLAGEVDASPLVRGLVGIAAVRAKAEKGPAALFEGSIDKDEMVSRYCLTAITKMRPLPAAPEGYLAKLEQLRDDPARSAIARTAAYPLALRVAGVKLDDDVYDARYRTWLREALTKTPKLSQVDAAHFIHQLDTWCPAELREESVAFLISLLQKADTTVGERLAIGDRFRGRWPEKTEDLGKAPYSKILPSLVGALSDQDPTLRQEIARDLEEFCQNRQGAKGGAELKKQGVAALRAAIGWEAVPEVAAAMRRELERLEAPQEDRALIDAEWERVLRASTVPETPRGVPDAQTRP